MNQLIAKFYWHVLILAWQKLTSNQLTLNAATSNLLDQVDKA